MEDIEIKVDVSKAEEGLQIIAIDLKELQKMAKGIGVGISKAFAPMINSLQGIEVNICALTDAVNATSGAIGQLVAQMGKGDSMDQWANGLSIAADGLVIFAELASTVLAIVGSLGRTAAVSQASFTAMGTIVPLVTEALATMGLTISAGGVLGAIAAIAAAIVGVILLITNWDTCQAALMQGISEFSESAGASWWSLYSVIQPIIDCFNEAIDSLWGNHLKPFWEDVCSACTSIGESVSTIWNEVLLPLINWIISIFAPKIVSTISIILGAVSAVIAVIADVVGSVFTIIDGLIQFITGVFTGEWEKAWEGFAKIFEGIFGVIVGIGKGVVNGVILAINTLIATMYSAIGAIVNGIGGIVKFTGQLVGQQWGFSIPSKPPQIPYLAKGAVLPANKPFLAVVGDQRHGTNVEAPLATIQEAVALVMNDHISAMMAGFEALLQEQRAIRQTVEGIEIGDTVIGRAVQRYNRKMAIVKGGY